MDELELRKVFKRMANCYADTGCFEKDGSYTEGDVIQAMTEDRFIETVNDLFTHTPSTPTPTKQQA